MILRGSPLLFLLFLFNSVKAQLPANSYSFNNTKDTVLSCGTDCFTLGVKVPYIGTYTSDYTVNRTGCFKLDPVTGPSTNLVDDDRYSSLIPMPFDFPFYDNYYSDLIIGTNGTISFDAANANAFSNWVIPANGNLPNTQYDRAVIMGPFHDIDIRPTTSPNRQIKYDIIGAKPHRKFVLSFYKVPCFDCNEKINNTYQIKLYEGLGIVEVHVLERDICATWNGGRAMVGMQNYERNKAIMAPGRTATSSQWGGLQMNEAWRFAPKEGPSLLKRIELYKSSGEFVATGDTVNDGNGNYNVSFNNICPDSSFTKYIVKSVYKNFEYALAPEIWPTADADSLIYAIDTINVIIPTPNSRETFWTGTVNSSWENAANWSCNNLPTSTSNVFIYSGNVIINSNVTINKLTVMPGANLTVNPGFNLTILSP